MINSIYCKHLRRRAFLLFYCEVCGATADLHHIIYRKYYNVDFKFNCKYLCPNHHRGPNGPHKNKIVDITYKLELQNYLYEILDKDFYSLKELTYILELSVSATKKVKNSLKLYKEGYKKEELILFLMSGKTYSEEMLEDMILQEAILHN